MFTRKRVSQHEWFPSSSRIWSQNAAKTFFCLCLISRKNNTLISCEDLFFSLVFTQFGRRNYINFTEVLSQAKCVGQDQGHREGGQGGTMIPGPIDFRAPREGPWASGGPTLLWNLWYYEISMWGPMTFLKRHFLRLFWSSHNRKSPGPPSALGAPGQGCKNVPPCKILQFKYCF